MGLNIVPSTSPEGAKDYSQGLEETEIRVRGKVNVEDYLFGKDVKTQYKAEDSFAFDLPSAFTLRPETDLKTFPDGCYTIRMDLTSCNGNLSFSRKVTFAGHQLKRLAAECAALERKLAGAGKKLSAAGRFACQVKIGELRRALSGRDLAAARRLAAELKNELK